jgi:hypothetical protein
MSLRLVTSLNWLIGIFILGAALFWPLLHDALYIRTPRANVEAKVQEIVKAELQGHQSDPSFLYFSSKPEAVRGAERLLGVSITNANFVFDAVSDADNALIVRAYTSPDALVSGRLPPMLYQHMIRNSGDAGEGQWVSLGAPYSGLLGIKIAF